MVFRQWISFSLRFLFLWVLAIFEACYAGVITTSAPTTVDEFITDEMAWTGQSEVNETTSTTPTPRAISEELCESVSGRGHLVYHTCVIFLSKDSNYKKYDKVSHLSAGNIRESFTDRTVYFISEDISIDHYAINERKSVALVGVGVLDGGKYRMPEISPLENPDRKALLSVNLSSGQTVRIEYLTINARDSGEREGRGNSSDHHVLDLEFDGGRFVANNLKIKGIDAVQDSVVKAEGEGSLTMLDVAFSPDYSADRRDERPKERKTLIETEGVSRISLNGVSAEYLMVTGRSNDPWFQFNNPKILSLKNSVIPNLRRTEAISIFYTQPNDSVSLTFEGNTMVGAFDSTISVLGINADSDVVNSIGGTAFFKGNSFEEYEVWNPLPHLTMTGLDMSSTSTSTSTSTSRFEEESESSTSLPSYEDSASTLGWKSMGIAVVLGAVGVKLVEVTVTGIVARVSGNPNAWLVLDGMLCHIPKGVLKFMADIVVKTASTDGSVDPAGAPLTGGQR